MGPRFLEIYVVLASLEFSRFFDSAPSYCSLGTLGSIQQKKWKKSGNTVSIKLNKCIDNTAYLNTNKQMLMHVSLIIHH